VAIIDNYKIAWAGAFGVTAPGGTEPVTTSTLFQAGSISKPVAAVGAMWLVEHGKLSLDEDVNKKLKSWKVPENEFTKDQKVTLRRLMSHSAGLTVHGFPGYAVGTQMPTLVQIFNGEKPANTDPIRVDFVPGTKMRYSGGGVTIEQQLVIDVTGKPFPQFMHDTVLSKIGMTDSSYEQPLPPERAPTARPWKANGTSIRRWRRPDCGQRPPTWPSSRLKSLSQSKARRTTCCHRRARRKC
jgi:CubicO group peptidase (beta-lactamase class C family)